MMAASMHTLSMMENPRGSLFMPYNSKTVGAQLLQPALPAVLILENTPPLGNGVILTRNRIAYRYVRVDTSFGTKRDAAPFFKGQSFSLWKRLRQEVSPLMKSTAAKRVTNAFIVDFIFNVWVIALCPIRLAPKWIKPCLIQPFWPVSAVCARVGPAGRPRNPR